MKLSRLMTMGEDAVLDAIKTLEGDPLFERLLKSGAVSTRPLSKAFFGTRRAFGISSITGPVGALIGVFIGPNLPNDAATPPNVNVTNPADREVVRVTPLLHQPFYVGRGRTAAGAPKDFVAPPGATRLFLGVLDDGDQNGDNSGSFTVTVSSR